MIIVLLLGYVVISTSTQSTWLADAQGQLQSSMRDVMQAIEMEAGGVFEPEHRPTESAAA